MVSPYYHLVNNTLGYNEERGILAMSQLQQLPVYILCLAVSVVCAKHMHICANRSNVLCPCIIWMHTPARKLFGIQKMSLSPSETPISQRKRKTILNNACRLKQGFVHCEGILQLMSCCRLLALLLQLSQSLEAS